MPFSKASLQYCGGLIVPKQKVTDVTPLPSAYPADGQYADALHFGGRPFAIDVAHREFLLASKYGRVVRLAMVEPAPHTDGTPNSFPTAPYISDVMVELSGPSALANPPQTDQSWFEMNDALDPTNCSLSGIHVVDAYTLACAGAMYYDANNTHRRCAFLADWPAEKPATSYQSNRTAFRAIGEPTSQGLIAGYFAPIPEAWQDRLGGDTLIGQASLPVISRGSAGPCAASFRVGELVERDPAMTLLVGYPNDHWMPDHPWDSLEPDDVYAMGTQITGMAIVGDTLVFVGSHGYGPPCYGHGTSDESLHNTPSPDGELWCYDPTTTAKANHAYPYRCQVWHYPLADLADVADGVRDPWSLEPQWFELDLPFTYPTKILQGCAFDPITNRLYVASYASDGYGYEPGPVIYAFDYLGDDVTPPDPPVGCEDQDAQIKHLQQQLALVTLALYAERQRHANTKAAVAAEAELIAEAAARILGLTE